MPIARARTRRQATCAAALLFAFVSAASAQPPVAAPEAFFGFRIGTDRQLASAEAIERYFEHVAASSARVRLVDLGATTGGQRTPAAIISSPENLANLEAIQQANRRLADPRTLSSDEAAALMREHKAVVAIGCSIHASEVGSSQAANELLHRLATASDADTLATLDQTVVIVIPMLNPDGHRLVTEWYAQHRGTAFEGGAMPWPYHKYAGHDINRDAFMMNLAESRNLAAFFYGQWQPQVFVTLHQMGPDGPRIFVPPNTDPIDANYDPLIWRTAGLLGGAMAFELQREGRRGVVSNAMYDYYWPGYEDSAPLGHNTVCLLVEVASVRVASPVTVPAGDLRGGQQGLPDYRPLINFPDPWPGGLWTLRDIVDYDLTAVRGLLTAVTRYRASIVRNFYDMGLRAVEAGRRGGPFAFVIPPAQHDPQAAAQLRELLLRGHIEIHRAIEAFRADGETYPAGSDIILLAQPYRAYVKTLLERQRYPGPIGRTGTAERPYDVTGWTLPLQMGVDVRAIERPFETPSLSRVTTGAPERAPVLGERRPGHFIVDARGTAGLFAVSRLIAAGVPISWTVAPRDVGGFTYAPGSLIVSRSRASEATVARIAAEVGLRADGLRGPAPRDLPRIGRARVGLYAPWLENTSEGWMRWAFDRYGLPYTTVRDADIRRGGLRGRFDAIVIPSVPADRLVDGNPAAEFPEAYVGGLGDSGLAALRAFVNEGGTLVALEQAGELVIKTFNLPVRDVVRSEETFFGPGSLVRLNLDPQSPLAFGMPPRTAAFFAFSAAYEGSGPDVATVARYGSEDVLLSGYLVGEGLIAGRGAVIQAKVGTGHVVLVGFPPHHRGQSLATFRILFNAVLMTPGPDRTR